VCRLREHDVKSLYFEVATSIRSTGRVAWIKTVSSSTSAPSLTTTSVTALNSLHESLANTTSCAVTAPQLSLPIGEGNTEYLFYLEVCLYKASPILSVLMIIMFLSVGLGVICPGPTPFCRDSDFVSVVFSAAMSYCSFCRCRLRRHSR
jgi:hypothetical protein